MADNRICKAVLKKPNRIILDTDIEFAYNGKYLIIIVSDEEKSTSGILLTENLIS